MMIIDSHDVYDGDHFFSDREENHFLSFRFKKEPSIHRMLNNIKRLFKSYLTDLSAQEFALTDELHHCFK